MWQGVHWHHNLAFNLPTMCGSREEDLWQLDFSCFLGARKAEHDSMVWLLLHVKTDTVNKILQSQEISYRFWYMFLLHYIIYNYKLYSNFKLNYDYMLQRYLWANTLSLQLNWPQLNGERFQIEEFLTYTDVYWYWYVGDVKSMMTPG